MKVRPQIIASPTYRKNKRIHDKLRREAEQESRREVLSNYAWGEKLSPLSLKHTQGPLPYTRHWYAGGRTA